MALLKEVLKEIKPEKVELNKKVNSFIADLKNELKKMKIKANVVVGGSFAKDTFLKGDYDCDIFVKFDYSYKDKDISSILSKALKKFNAIKIPGSRNYYQVKNEINYEVVPVLDIKKPKQALNVMDVSPLHTAWVKKYKLNDEIRLAKAFCKAAGVYGAESYIRGFSGHVLDILTIYYGSFLHLLRAAKKWKPKEVIDVMKYHKDALLELNKSKLQSPLIVIDPIQPDRNAAAALSYEAFEKFKRKAQEFLKNPSKKFFIKHELTIDEIKEKGKDKKLILFNVESLPGKEDISGTKLLKAFEYIKEKLSENEFKIFDFGWQWDKKSKALFWFVLNKEDLPKTTIKKGPPIKMKKHVDAFKKKYKKTFVKENRIYAEVKRKYVRPENLVKILIKDKYVKERVYKIEL